MKYFIERKDTNEWYYIGDLILDELNPHILDCETGWTNDPNKAHPFKTREKATGYFYVINDTTDDNLIVTEHEFVNHP